LAIGRGEGHNAEPVSVVRYLRPDNVQSISHRYTREEGINPTSRTL